MLQVGARSMTALQIVCLAGRLGIVPTVVRSAQLLAGRLDLAGHPRHAQAAVAIAKRYAPMFRSSD